MPEPAPHPLLTLTALLAELQVPLVLAPQHATARPPRGCHYHRHGPPLAEEPGVPLKLAVATGRARGIGALAHRHPGAARPPRPILRHDKAIIDADIRCGSSHCTALPHPVLEPLRGL